MSLFRTIGELKKGVQIALAVLVVGAVYGLYLVTPSSVKKTVANAPVIRTVVNAGDKPINVCVNTWGGFAGGQWYNGGFEASKDSRFYKEQGILVNFIKMDDFNGTRNAWKAGECDLMWGTIDSFVTEADGLSDQKPMFAFQIDWSRGGDVIVATRDIKSINDARGRKWAVAYGTPSHSLLLWALNSAGLTTNDVEIINTNEEPAAVSAFKGHQSDLAIVWSPDDKDLYGAVPGSHALVSTKQATDIIADSLFYKASWGKANRDKLARLYRGWMIGNAKVNSDATAFEEAVKITAKGYTQEADFMREAIRNTRLTTHGDNRNFFGLASGYTGVKAEDIYSKTGDLYKKMKFIDRYPTYRSVSDPSIIAEAEGLDTADQAAEGMKQFAEPTPQVASASALSSKPITVNFPLNSALLDDRSQSIIDEKLVDVARQFRGSYIRIEGNTDSTGDPARNKALSRDRANSVADYLVSQYKFDRKRFVVVGNGSSKAKCNEQNPDRPLEACRAMNRRTEFQVLNSQ
jgi:NitT/TauT family transport system substrate-binding protein